MKKKDFNKFGDKIYAAYIELLNNSDNIRFCDMANAFAMAVLFVGNRIEENNKGTGLSIDKFGELVAYRILNADSMLDFIKNMEDDKN